MGEPEGLEAILREVRAIREDVKPEKVKQTVKDAVDERFDAIKEEVLNLAAEAVAAASKAQEERIAGIEKALEQLQALASAAGSVAHGSAGSAASTTVGSEDGQPPPQVPCRPRLHGGRSRAALSALHEGWSS